MKLELFILTQFIILSIVVQLMRWSWDKNEKKVKQWREQVTDAINEHDRMLQGENDDQEDYTSDYPDHFNNRFDRN